MILNYKLIFMKNLNLTKQEKIILVLSKISNSAKRNIKFEDIVVDLFKKFPKDFHLKGYDKYPDSGDSVKRALYTLRDRGFLLVNNMIFSLTDKGIDSGEKLINHTKGVKITGKNNLDRYVLNEINRIKKLEGFKFFVNKEENKIFDTDFYNYFGVSVKTEKSEFLGRLNTIEDLIATLQKEQKRNQIENNLISYHQFIINKFTELINYYRKD